MSGTRTCLACTVALLVTAGAAAADSPLEPVRSSVEQVRFEEAALALDEVLATGELAPDELAEAYRLGADIQAALGNDTEVATWLARWLSVSPGARLPAGTSPKLLEPFAAAKAKLDGAGGMRIAVESQREGDEVRFRVRVTGDPLGLATGARIDYRAGRAKWAVVHGGLGERVPIAVPTAARVQYVAYAVDAAGNRLVARGSAAAPEELAPATPGVLGAEAPRTRPATAWYARWYPYAGLSVASLALAGVFALDVRDVEDELEQIVADSSNHSFSDARALEERGERHTLYANIGLAVGVVAGITSVVLAVRGSDEAIVVAPTASGADVALSWRF